MASTVRQTNFSAGELEPLLWGRNDLSLFSKGVRTCRNFFITKAGAAMSRPGSLFVAETKYPDPPSPFAFTEVRYGQVRLIPFIAGDDASYVVEVGSGYLRFHSLGATVEASPGVPYEVTTYTKADGTTAAFPYTWAYLNRICYSQVGDVLVMTHPQYPALELRFIGATNWELREVDLSRPSPVFPDVGSSTFKDPFNVNPPDQEAFTTNFMLLEPLPIGDLDHPESEWLWLVTAIMQEISTGEVFESLGQMVTKSTDGVETLVPFGTEPVQNDITDTTLPVFVDRPVTLVRLTATVSDPSLYKTLAFNIYRGRGDLFGFIGQTRTRTFVDVGQEPDYATQPPAGNNPFRVLAADGTVARIENPATVAHFQGRRAFGGTNDSNGVQRRSNTVWLSTNNDWYNFDTRLAIHVSGEALEFELASQRRETIRHLVGKNKLLIGTNSNWWSMDGGQGQPLDFDHVEAKIIESIGTTYVRPLELDKAVLYARAKGTGVRALVPEGQDDYQGTDISVHASHLFIGSELGVVDWAYAEDPYGLVWVVRADGSLLSLTFVSGQMAAWARHDTDGTYEAICSVPEGEEDAVYVVVRRTINGTPKRYIERFTSRVRRVLETDDPPTFVTSPTVEDTNSLYPTDVAVDCAFTYVGAPTLTIEDAELLKLVGKSVYVVARGAPVMGPYVVQNNHDTTGIVELDDQPEAFAANAVNGVGAPIWVAHVGLSFTADLESLSIRGESTLAQKTIVEVGFELDNARGIQAGQDSDHLTEWQQRDVADGYTAISAATVLLYTPVDNTWDKDARVFLRQSLPLPVTVVGISRSVERGD